MHKIAGHLKSNFANFNILHARESNKYYDKLLRQTKAISHMYKQKVHESYVRKAKKLNLLQHFISFMHVKKNNPNLMFELIQIHASK
jgi:hypothetical protein